MNALEIIAIVLCVLLAMLGTAVTGYCYGYRQGIRAMTKYVLDNDLIKEIDESEDEDE